MASMNLSPPSPTTSSLRLPTAYRTYSASKTLPFHSTHIKNLSFSSSIPLKSTKTRPRHLNLIVSSVKKLSESESVPVPPDSDAAVFPPASGVYAVYDKNGDMQFVGLSRNIQASILHHQKSVPELCGSVKGDKRGRPRSTRLRNEMDVKEKKRNIRCGICREVGHNRARCPSKPRKMDA